MILQVARTSHVYEPADIGWPAEDVLVLRNRPIRIGTDPSRLSRFAEDVWHIQPAHPDAHITISPISWRRFPTALTHAFKAFFLAALDHPYPVGPGGQRGSERPSVGRFNYWVIDLVVFSTWLADRGITRICDITDRDLDAYRGHVLALSRSPRRKSDLFSAVRTLWLYRAHLPADCRLTDYPWDGLSEADLVKTRYRNKWENKTPRIAPETMDTLLAWSLLMVEQIGPDIRNAWIEYRQFEEGTHTSQEPYAGMLLQERLTRFVARAREADVELPGRPGRDGATDPNFGHILRLIGIPAAQRAGLTRNQKTMVLAAGLPIAANTYIGTIAGRVDGRPWRDRPITVAELPTLVRLLYAGTFVVVCYLSGMRPGEVLNLPHGCRGVDADTGELLIQGRRGKGFNRYPIASETGRPNQPWVVVAPVHDAVGLLESLAEFPYLFPASLISTHTRRPNTANARSANAMIADLSDFVSWVNATFSHSDGSTAIPADPTKHLHGSRFRRTLAYFIVRRPRGLIAAALQYGHVSTKVTLNYSGRADTSWMDDLAVEKLEMVLEHIEHDTHLLDGGEHISGPSADEYRARLHRATGFAGRVVNQVRNAERLLRDTDPNIHHGDAMTCVWRAETAACRQANLAIGLPADAPDESQCRSTCSNIAYTDRDIEQLRRHLREFDVSSVDPLAPRPLRTRSAMQAASLRTIIDKHERSRSAPDHGEGQRS